MIHYIFKVQLTLSDLDEDTHNYVAVIGTYLRRVGDEVDVKLTRTGSGPKLYLAFKGLVSRQWIDDFNAMLNCLKTRESATAVLNRQASRESALPTA